MLLTSVVYSCQMEYIPIVRPPANNIGVVSYFKKPHENSHDFWAHNLIIQFRFNVSKCRVIPFWNFPVLY
jgi:hypothetical protein